MRQIWRVWLAQFRLVAGTIRGTLVSRATFWFSGAEMPRVPRQSARFLRDHLAGAARGLARGLRAERHRLYPDAGDTARTVAPAPALGRGRRADDVGILPPDDRRPRTVAAADLHQLRFERVLVLSRTVVP